MLSAGLAVEPAHRVGHGLGALGSPAPGALGSPLASPLGSPLGGASHSHSHNMLTAFANSEFLRPFPVAHRPGEPGPGAAMFSPPDLRCWLHHQQQQHLARTFAVQGVNPHRMSTTLSSVPAPSPGPSPVNLSSSHKDNKDRLPHPPPMGYPYPSPYPVYGAHFASYASRPPPPSEGPAATYSPPAGSTAPLPPPAVPLPPPTAPAPKTAAKTFKVPSGKEGSLKHRILTHPPRSAHQAHQPQVHQVHQAHQAHQPLQAHQAAAQPAHLPERLDRLERISSNTATAYSVDFQQPASLPYFWKNSIIRLESGELIRVSDIRVEDLIASADRSPDTKTDSATIIRIQHKGPRVHLTLNLNSSNEETEFETVLEHPFFVFGQGWSSCSPERSERLFGIPCQPLQAGHQILSLKKRSTQLPGSSAASAPVPHAPAPPAPAPRRPRQPRKQAAAPSSDSTSTNNKKRRWSAPDQLTSTEEPSNNNNNSKLPRVPEWSAV